MNALDLNDDQRLRVEAAMADAADQPSFRYPWDGLEAALAKRGSGSLPMIGYGSLVNLASAARTLGEASLATARPVVCFGVRRVFDYEMPANIARYAEPATPDARAALNVHPTGSSSDALNGLLFDMPQDDVQAMREREIGYDLLPVACLAWDALDAPAFTAWLLSAPAEPPNGTTRVNVGLTPHVAYFALCREGAAGIGEPFLRLWRDTTYMGDGTTPVAAWESRHCPESS
jgi:hypothetical protein